MAGHCGLPDPLARPDHGQRRARERLEADRVEAEVRARIRDPAGQHPAGDAEAARRVGDGLVGEVEHDLGRSGLERLLEGLEDRDTVVLSPTQLLRASEEDGADHLVPDARERDPDDIRVVLPVDQGDGFHCLLVTSLSMRVVYFSNSRVSAENWMMRSWSWYGYFRQTSTCLPSISIRL